MSNPQQSDLEISLYEQLDDSVRSRQLDKVLWAVVKNPPRLDSSSLAKSKEYMHYALNAQGFFSDTINYSVAIKPKNNLQRAFVTFDVYPGPVTRIDSLSYTLKDSALQQLADSTLSKALVKKNDPFSQSPLSGELDRLVDVYKQNGYIKFSRDLLFVLWDTLDVSLLQPTLDPLEQSALLERMRDRKLNPIANVDIQLRPITDSTRTMQYYVGNVTIYPNNRTGNESGTPRETTIGNTTIVQYGNQYRAKMFPGHNYLKKGELYRQARFERTVNKLNSLGSFRMVNIEPVLRPNEDTVDFNIRLTPAKKYNFTINLESSLSQTVLSGSLIGIGFNAGLQNRNFLKSGNIFSTNIRYGVELGKASEGSFFQSRQLSLINTVAFPRFIIPGFKTLKTKFRGNYSTLLSVAASYTERRFLYNWSTFNAYWGYDFLWRDKSYAKNNKTYNLNIRLPNIESSYLDKLDSLNKMILQNPSINNLFSDGFIASTIGRFTMPWSTRNQRVAHVLKANFEQSGLLTGMIRNSFLDERLYRFVKFDLEYARLIKFRKTVLVMRGFGGVGYELDATRNPDKKYNLPFFKQYFAGGPNSMRAWQLRRLGPGNIVDRFTGTASYPDRFGDVQLEANVEYRMPLIKVAGIPINGALFTDIGNVWFLKKMEDDKEGVFDVSKLGRDLAIGSGAGVRVDLGFFVIRLDYAYKIKDPSPSPGYAAYQNKFFAYPFFKGSQFQLGIGYPFIF